MATVIDLPKDKIKAPVPAEARIVIFPGGRAYSPKGISNIACEGGPRYSPPKVERTEFFEGDDRVVRTDFGYNIIEEIRYHFLPGEKFAHSAQFVRSIDGIERFKGFDCDLDGRLEIMEIKRGKGLIIAYSVGETWHLRFPEKEQSGRNRPIYGSDDPVVPISGRKRETYKSGQQTLLARIEGNVTRISENDHLEACQILKREVLPNGTALYARYFFREGQRHSSATMVTLEGKSKERIWRTFSRMEYPDTIGNRYLHHEGLTRVVGFTLKHNSYKP